MSVHNLTKLRQNHQIGKILALPVNKKFTDGPVNKFYRFLLIYCSKIAHLTKNHSSSFASVLNHIFICMYLHLVPLHELRDRLGELVVLGPDGDAVVLEEGEGLLHHLRVQQGAQALGFPEEGI